MKPNIGVEFRDSFVIGLGDFIPIIIVPQSVDTLSHDP